MAITVNQIAVMEELINTLDDDGVNLLLAEVLRARDASVKAGFLQVADVFNELYCIIGCV